MPNGTLISFKDDRGYGFIKPEDGTDNVYLHISALQESGVSKINPGQALSYELHSENGKTSAVKIKLL